jgi:hypothetical protein
MKSNFGDIGYSRGSGMTYSTVRRNLEEGQRRHGGKRTHVGTFRHVIEGGEKVEM